jgi:DNA polymerase-3 subunit delta'
MGFDAYQRDLQPQFHSLWDVIARDPVAVARQLAVNCVTHLRDDARLLLGWPTAACTALGVALAARRGTLACGWPFVLAAGISFLALVPVFHSERYSLILLPYYAAAAAFFFAAPGFALAFGGRVWLKPALAVIPVALSVVGSVDLQRRILAQQPTEALAAAGVLRSLAHPGDRVIARKPHVAALSGVGAVGFPFADSLAQLGDYARREHARWLYFGFPEAETRPVFRYLLDTSAVVPGLTARNVTTGRPSVLYEIGPGFGALPAWFRNDTLVALHDARATALASPNDVRALRTAGSIELASGDLAGAREHLEHAADLAPNDVDLLLPLGETFLRLGDPALAARAYERAEQVSPGNVQARIGRGWASLLAGREREAADLAPGDRAHAERSDARPHARSLPGSGRCCGRSRGGGDPAEARAALTAAPLLHASARTRYAAGMPIVRLAELIDQPAASGFMRGVVGSGRYATAYLFEGPPGVGKGTAALAFARAILCEHGGGGGGPAAAPDLFAAPAPAKKPAPADDACGVCAACTKTATFQHPDLKFLFPVSGEEKELEKTIPETLEALREDPLFVFNYEKAASIRLSLTRELIRELAFHPFEAAHRVVVVRDADRMREDQYSALLVDQGAGPSTVWVLTTSRVNRLPATIRSRCHRIRFAPLGEETVSAFLEQRAKVKPDAARLIAALSSGSLARALTLRLNDPIETRNKALALLDPALRGASSDLWKSAQSFMSYGRTGRESIRRMIEFHGCGCATRCAPATAPGRCSPPDRESGDPPPGADAGCARDPPKALGARGGTAGHGGQRNRRSHHLFRHGAGRRRAPRRGGMAAASGGTLGLLSRPVRADCN